ncbi:MAG TPA: MFS transporter [Mycobacteriales bacterium]|nr:MFS transporter [Mycobacteriales bacterium]
MATTLTEPARTAPPSDSHAHVHPNLALAVIAVAQLMVVLDATIVNIALPQIQTGLHFSSAGLSWVLNAYTLTFGGLLLLGGRMGDLFGRRRVFIVGVLVFALASLLGGFAQDQAWLLAMRALQGVGGAIASPTALALVATTFEEGEARNRALGVYAAVSGAGAALGLILGGVLTDLLSWRWVLFVNAPIGIALAIATPYVIAETTGRKGDTLDVPGAVTSTVGMAALVYGFIHAATNSWGSATTIVSFVVGAVLLTAFLVIEARSRSPLMPLRLFRDLTRVGSYLVMLILGAAVFAMFYFLTQFVQDILGFSPLKAGFAFLPVSATIVVVAQIASRLIAKIGPQPLVVAGTLIAGYGLWWLSRLGVGSTYVAGVLPAIMLIAVGMGLLFVAVTLTAVSGVDDHESGIASAMLNVCQQVGGTIGLSALVTVFATAASNFASSHATSLRGPALQQHAFAHGADMAFLAGALFALAGVIAGFLLVRNRQLAADATSGPAALG